MSRNKVILFLITCAIAWYITPNEGDWYFVKQNILNFIPYILLFIIIYLVITINILKKRWRDVDKEPNDVNVQQYAKMLNITFDVKRMLGKENMIALYNKINYSQMPSMKSKRLLFEAYRRKRLDVAPPGRGSEIDMILSKSGKSKEELKIEAAERRRRKAKSEAKGKKLK